MRVRKKEQGWRKNGSEDRETKGSHYPVKSVVRWMSTREQRLEKQRVAVSRNDHILVFSEVFKPSLTFWKSFSARFAILLTLCHTYCCTWLTVTKALATSTNSNAHVSPVGSKVMRCTQGIHCEYVPLVNLYFGHFWEANPLYEYFLWLGLLPTSSLGMWSKLETWRPGGNEASSDWWQPQRQWDMCLIIHGASFGGCSQIIHERFSVQVAVPGRNQTLFHCAIRPRYQVWSAVAHNFWGRAHSAAKMHEYMYLISLRNAYEPRP